MAHDVFISYATKDKPIADAVCAILEGYRIRCWIAPRDIRPGVPYAKAIIDALNETQAMIVIFSSSANDSPNVMREVERAVNKGKMIIPLRVEQVIPSDSMEYLLAGVHWLDALTGPMEDHIRSLADTLAALLPSIAKRSQANQALPSEPQFNSKDNLGDATQTSFIEEFTGMEFVRIQGGEYEMGDFFGSGDANQKPLHRVLVSSFWLGRFPVTQQQWLAVMGSNPSKYQHGPDYPINGVSWLNVDEFISSLNGKTGQNFRLPTEAEWEFAARSGGKDEQWAGTSLESSVADLAWYYSKHDFGTRPVGQKKPNGLGLYDMSGNVWEWCSDWYDELYYAVSPFDNPQGPSSGTRRVYRGGSYLNQLAEARTTYRGNGPPFGCSSNLGFRLVMEK